MKQIDYGRPYIPQRDYVRSSYKPLGPSKQHFCLDCKDYYKKLYEKGVTSTPFPPHCQGDINKVEVNASGLTDDERDLLEIYKSPISFAAAEFEWTPRWYQYQMLSCTSQYVVVRGGRRLGKSQAIAILILWYLFINKDHTILVVCPYQSQVKAIFNQMRKFIGNSLSYKASVKRDVSSAPECIELNNGSKVVGFSSGANSGGKSSQVRGQDANFMILDEMDMLSDPDLESIMAILASHPDCKLWCSSTPTGARRQFFQYCINKDMGYKEWHFISPESPSWTDQAEKVLKMQYTDAGFAREFYAEFGEEADGVFSNANIISSLKQYLYSDCSRDDNARYVIGVDWNSNAGVHMVVTECYLRTDDQIRYKVVEKLIVEKQEFTQIKAVEEIIRLNFKWNPDFIYVDAGYGNTQVEMLHKFGKENPNTKLHIKVKPFNMGATIEIKDPIRNEKVKKPIKPFMVNIAARQVEAGRCEFPISEDTSIVGDEDELALSDKVGLVQQMRMFKVEKESKEGKPIYSQGSDHTLTAWMLTLMAFFLELSDINKSNKSSSVFIVNKLGSEKPDPNAMVPTQTPAEKAKELKQKTMPASRTLSKSLFLGSNTNAARALYEQRLTIRRENIERKESLNPRFPRPNGRASF